MKNDFVILEINDNIDKGNIDNKGNKGNIEDIEDKQKNENEYVIKKVDKSTYVDIPLNEEGNYNCQLFFGSNILCFLCGLYVYHLLS